MKASGCGSAQRTATLNSEIITIPENAVLTLDLRMREYDGYYDNNAELRIGNSVLERSADSTPWQWSDTGWKNKSYDLSAYAGQTLALSCYAKARTNNDCEHAMCYMDNIVLAAELPTFVCGDGNIDADEDCDDGNAVNGDGCSASCTVEAVLCYRGQSRYCIKNGYNGTESCNPDGSGWQPCIPHEWCGDAVINSVEACDDGNTVNGDGCSALCRVEISLNCTVGQNTSCLADGYRGVQWCNANGTGWRDCISLEYCGDGIVNGMELCDDGMDNVAGECNKSSCCSVACASLLNTAMCGNGIIDRGEECDGGLPSDLECEAFGYWSGEMECSHQCTFDFRNCLNETAANKTAEMYRRPMLLAIEPEEGAFEGYLVELDAEPLVITNEKLEAEVYREREAIRKIGWYNPSKYVRKLFAPNEKDVIRGVKAQEEVIDDLGEKVITEIKRKEGGARAGVQALAGEPDDILYKNVLTGFYVDDRADIEGIKKIPGVKNVYPNLRVNAMLSDSIPIIHADDIWLMEDDEGNPLTGKGTTIAILDTGVDYTHPDLGGCFGPGCKVMGGYDFANDDSDPMDDHMHGTHVAAIAAGNGALKGVAPDANILAVKVLAKGRGTVKDIVEGMEWTVDPNGDGDFSDRPDVVSMSLGANCFPDVPPTVCGPEDPLSRAANMLVSAGMVVVIAAGNRGPDEWSIGSPGVARDAITVGASYNNNEGGIFYSITVVNDDERVIESDLIDRSAVPESLTAHVVNAKYGRAEDFSSIDAAGKIALIIRGLPYQGSVMTFQEKVDNAVLNGAVGVIIRNDDGGIVETELSEGSDIPAFFISDVDGIYLSSLPDPIVRLDTSMNYDRIAWFSSRGPVTWTNEKGGAESINKPDIIAPGVSICAAQLGDAYSDRECLDDEHIAISGTSMATPHVAGGAALLKQAHPDWTPEEIKVALMISARDIGLSQNTQGSGVMDLNAALGVSNPTIAHINALGDVTGLNIDIIGTAKGSGFQEYALEMETESGLEGICSGTSQKNRESLCSLNIGMLDGQYKLRLTVRTADATVTDEKNINIVNTRIQYPKDRAYQESDPTEEGMYTSDPTDGYINAGHVDIIGNSYHALFSRFKIEWCDADELCSDEGISLSGNGNTPVLSGILAGWDTAPVPETGDYTLVLTTILNNGEEVAYTIRVFVEKELVSGFPYTTANYVNEDLFSFPEHFACGPKVVDMNGDGFKEIVVSSTNEEMKGVIEIISHDGTLFADPIVTPTHSGMLMPSVGDLDGDGIMEMVMSGTTETSNGPLKGVDWGENSKLRVYHSDGELVFEKDIEGSISCNTLSDIDNDGDLEIIVTSIIYRNPSRGEYNTIIHTFDHEGNYAEGWPVKTNENLLSVKHRGVKQVAVDLDFDGKKEILVNRQGSILAYSMDGRRLWEDTLEVAIMDVFGEYFLKYIYDFAIGDLDDDGDFEILALEYVQMDSPYKQYNSIYLYDHYGNIIKTGEKKEKIGSFASFVDTNNDGEKEIVFTGRGASVYNQDFQLLESWETTGNVFGYTEVGYYTDTIDVGDINNDGKAELVVNFGLGTPSGKVYAFTPEGSVIEGFPKELNQLVIAHNAPALVDIDNDGLIEIVAADGKQVYAYNTNGPADSVVWEQVYYDERNTRYMMPEGCDFDGICEGTETYHVCPYDCKSCGNGRAELDEVCDGDDLRLNTCRSYGFADGTLICSEDCKSIDNSGCPRMDFLPIPQHEVHPGRKFEYHFETINAIGDLKYTSTAMPPNMELHGDYITFWPEPSQVGEHSVTFTVTDGTNTDSEVAEFIVPESKCRVTSLIVNPDWNDVGGSHTIYGKRIEVWLTSEYCYDSGKKLIITSSTGEVYERSIGDSLNFVIVPNYNPEGNVELYFSAYPVMHPEDVILSEDNPVLACADNDNDNNGVLRCGDCNDNDAAISPDAEDICDWVDNNCNGIIDEDCAVCGDSECNNYEICKTCPLDCGQCPEDCGNNVCNGDETCNTCPDDCGTCPALAVCGDDSCNGDETCASCPSDCGACPPTPACGDGTCNGDETCNTCPSDCGICPPVCGDGTIDPGEECDDANTDNGDGCSAACEREAGYTCTGSPSVCNQCALSDAFWSTTETNEGEEVTLTAAGAYCDGLTTNFIVAETDGGILGLIRGMDLATNQPEPAVFSSGQATTTWTAEWAGDIAGDPEYVFDAALSEDAAITVTSSNQLTVRKGGNDKDGDGVPNGIDCNDYDEGIGRCQGCAVCSDEAGEHGACVGQNDKCKVTQCPPATCGIGGCKEDEIAMFEDTAEGLCVVSDDKGECSEGECSLLSCTPNEACLSDEDGDGVADYSDRCPKTPASMKARVSAFNGCPRPKATKFDHELSTDFAKVHDLFNVSRMSLGIRDRGRVEFIENVSVLHYNALVDASNRYHDYLDLDAIIIEHNRIRIDTSIASLHLDLLNKPANVTFYNLAFSNPRILRDGSVCSDCVILNYKDGNLTFSVPGWSEYVSEETPVPVESGSSSSSSGGGGGGGGGGGAASTSVSAGADSPAIVAVGKTRVEANALATLEIDHPGIAITKLILRAREQPLVLFTLKVEAIQSAANPLPDAYQYDQVTHIKISEEQYTDASVEFRVPLAIDDGVLDKDSVSLSLFGSSWQELSAHPTTAMAGYQYYEAEVPYFGLFGIQARAMPPAQEARATGTLEAVQKEDAHELLPSEEAERSQGQPNQQGSSMTIIKGAVFIAAFLLILLFVAIVLLQKKR
ncbi:TPA: S8 family serine peptidase [Candidatus Woesearchaeota archaeon]|nr:S8 family serine peptidase [Candidatus Woesearchaeota archaeon]